MSSKIEHGESFTVSCPGLNKNPGVAVVLTKDGTIFNAEVRSLLSGETLVANYIETLDDLGLLVREVQEW